MTIDKFGRHIHKHVLKRHLMDVDVVSDFLKHPKFQEVLQMHRNNIPSPSATETSKYIIPIYSDGSIGLMGYYVSTSLAKQTYLYKNKVYRGKVINVHYSNEKLTTLQVNKELFNSKRPIELTEGTTFRLIYVGTKPTPPKTEAVFAEIVIEGNVVN